MESKQLAKDVMMEILLLMMGAIMIANQCLTSLVMKMSPLELSAFETVGTAELIQMSNVMISMLLTETGVVQSVKLRISIIVSIS